MTTSTPSPVSDRERRASAIHYHVYQQARTGRRGTHQQIGHAVSTLKMAKARVLEYRRDRGQHYRVFHDPACGCLSSGPIDEED